MSTNLELSSDELARIEAVLDIEPSGHRPRKGREIEVETRQTELAPSLSDLNSLPPDFGASLGELRHRRGRT